MQTNIKTIYVDMDGIKTSNEAWLDINDFDGNYQISNKR